MIAQPTAKVADDRVSEPEFAAHALWNLSLAQVQLELATSKNGLGAAEAARRLAAFGANDALQTRRPPLWRQIADRLANPLILILLFAGSLSAWTGQVTSFAIIVAIIAMSVVLDVVQQRRAENTVDTLRRSVALRADVLRDGQIQSVPVATLVQGDIIRLGSGDIVPADCRLIEARNFYVNQALMTGESFPVEKQASDLDTLIEDGTRARNWLSMGTSAISGSATAVVCRTGRATSLGSLATVLNATRPPDAFQYGIHQFGVLMVRLTIFLVLFVLAANTLFQRPWLETLLFALALAVGLTPELLPMVVTVTLAKGARRMADRRVIVKRLAAIHDLGAMDVLCTDKTGTLTEARIKLDSHVDADDCENAHVFQLAALNSTFETGIKSPLDDAILNHDRPDLSAWNKIDEVPFDFERRRVSVLVDDGTNRLLIVKGAPEDLISLSAAIAQSDGTERPLDDGDRRRLLVRYEQFGDQGLRVLAVATRAMERSRTSAAIDDESTLTFVGFLTFIDPPKPEAAAAIAALARSGVDVKILSGDNERITRHICGQIGMLVTGVLTGHDLARMSEDALRARLPDVNIFCRVTPQQKERVLLALKRTGAVVGFLGDGVNDASALHAADVGISVDSAADVAKEAADLVLLDHDLGVVHDGVIEGRRTVENVTKYILMGSSSNLGNMMSMAGAALFLPFLPMLPTQVLLNNLLYDVSEVGVPFDNVDVEALRAPARWDIRNIVRFMFVLGPVSSLFDFLTFFALLRIFKSNEALFQTGWFVESLATQSLVIFVIRTRGRPWLTRPHALLAGLSIGVVVVGALLPLSPLGPALGFVVPPAGFYLFLVAAVGAYLVMVDWVKRAVLTKSEQVLVP